MKIKKIGSCFICNKLTKNYDSCIGYIHKKCIKILIKDMEKNKEWWKKK